MYYKLNKYNTNIVTDYLIDNLPSISFDYYLEEVKRLWFGKNEPVKVLGYKYTSSISGVQKDKHCRVVIGPTLFYMQGFLPILQTNDAEYKFSNNLSTHIKATLRNNTIDD